MSLHSIDECTCGHNAEMPPPLALPFKPLHNTDSHDIPTLPLALQEPLTVIPGRLSTSDSFTDAFVQSPLKELRREDWNVPLAQAEGLPSRAPASWVLPASYSELGLLRFCVVFLCRLCLVLGPCHLLISAAFL